MTILLFFCKDKEELLKEYPNHNGVNMKKVNEIIRININGTVTENLSIYNL